MIKTITKGAVVILATTTGIALLHQKFQDEFDFSLGLAGIKCPVCHIREWMRAKVSDTRAKIDGTG